MSQYVERVSRSALIDFIKGLIEFDPVKRWSPLQVCKLIMNTICFGDHFSRQSIQSRFLMSTVSFVQASKHPFVTGEPFTCPYKPVQETPHIVSYDNLWNFSSILWLPVRLEAFGCSMFRVGILDFKSILHGKCLFGFYECLFVLKFIFVECKEPMIVKQFYWFWKVKILVILPFSTCSFIGHV